MASGEQYGSIQKCIFEIGVAFEQLLAEERGVSHVVEEADLEGRVREVW